MGQVSLQIPQSGQPNSTEDPKIASDFTAIQNVLNGGIDATNLNPSTTASWPFLQLATSQNLKVQAATAALTLPQSGGYQTVPFNLGTAWSTSHLVCIAVLAGGNGLGVNVGYLGSQTSGLTQGALLLNITGTSSSVTISYVSFGY